MPLAGWVRTSPCRIAMADLQMQNLSLDRYEWKVGDEDTGLLSDVDW